MEEKEIKKKSAPKKKTTTTASKAKTAPKKKEGVKLAKPVEKAVLPEPAVKPELPQKAEVVVVPKEKKPKKKKTLGPVKYHGVGRRKTAVARVWLVPGQGRISVNRRPLKEYMNNRILLEIRAYQPLVLTNSRESYDVIANIFGGGIPAQADALRLGIARALLQVNPDFKPVLSKEGMLSRDPREKERKKYGHKRARKSFQYSKR